MKKRCQELQGNLLPTTKEENNNCEQSKNSRVVSVVLVGDSGVGKSCILDKYMNGTFDGGKMTTIGGNATFSLVVVVSD